MLTYVLFKGGVKIGEIVMFILDVRNDKYNIFGLTEEELRLAKQAEEPEEFGLLLKIGNKITYHFPAANQTGVEVSYRYLTEANKDLPKIIKDAAASYLRYRALKVGGRGLGLGKISEYNLVYIEPRVFKFGEVRREFITKQEVINFITKEATNILTQLDYSDRVKFASAVKSLAKDLGVSTVLPNCFKALLADKISPKAKEKIRKRAEWYKVLPLLHDIDELMKLPPAKVAEILHTYDKLNNVHHFLDDPIKDLVEFPKKRESIVGPIFKGLQK